MYITFTLCTLWTFYFIYRKKVFFLLTCHSSHLEHVDLWIFVIFQIFLSSSNTWWLIIKWNLSLMLFLWIYLPRVYLLSSSCLQKQLLENWKVCYQTTEGTKHSCLLHTACLPVLPPRKIYMKGGVTCMKYAFIKECSPWNKKIS
jgi:hypothetical protein